MEDLILRMSMVGLLVCVKNEKEHANPRTVPSFSPHENVLGESVGGDTDLRKLDFWLNTSPRKGYADALMLRQIADVALKLAECRKLHTKLNVRTKPTNTGGQRTAAHAEQRVGACSSGFCCARMWPVLTESTPANLTHNEQTRTTAAQQQQARLGKRPYICRSTSLVP